MGIYCFDIPLKIRVDKKQARSSVAPGRAGPGAAPRRAGRRLPEGRAGFINLTQKGLVTQSRDSGVNKSACV